ncbi:MAG: antibiotic biosynthesis monooxygenase [Oleispira sp.]|nr:antibiotic biosynthesis monooxygenase [Oleispira sp.]MBL4880341.1 antibiotic biosynthesis monooxygenase [Oleispira sp.]
MSVTVILEAKVKEGRKARLLKLLTKLLPDTHNFNGFIDISIYSEADTELVIFISKWHSFEVYQ